MKTHDRGIVHSSGCPNWRTEDALFEVLDREFKFAWDLAATKWNRKVTNYLGPDHENPTMRDALSVVWCPPGQRGARWLNPPFSREEKQPIDPWIAKCDHDAREGDAPIVALVPSRTDTRWWTAHIRRAVEIRHIPHRVRFYLSPEELEEVNAARAAAGKPIIKNTGESAGFPSAVVIWRPQPGIIGPAAPRVVTWSYRTGRSS